MEEYVRVDKMDGRDDAEQIQNAVAEAKRTGVNRIVVPQRNERTGREIWDISHTIYLPSDIEVVLYNAHLRLADNSFCNMFSNENILHGIARTKDGEQRNIRIHGIGNAILDGGEYNGLSERNSEKDGLPSILVNTTLLFFNVSNLCVENLSIINQRWWGMTNIFVRDSVFRGIRFEADLSWVDENGVHHPEGFSRDRGEIYVRNADGIDLRIGCHDIRIENISGFTEDDTVALTALGGFERQNGLIVEGEPCDIHDVKIRNVASDSHVCAVVRLLNDEGNKLYNIDIDGVTHMRCGKHNDKARYVIRIGDMAYANEHSTLGDTHHISIRNVFSHGTYAISLCKGLSDSTIDNVVVASDGNYGFGGVENGRAVIKNVRFGDFFLLSENASAFREGSFAEEE